MRSPALPALALAIGAGCSDVAREGGSGREHLVVYASADEPVARAVVEAFERGHGIPVTLQLDTEASKTVGLAQRLRSERDAPRADLFWSSECVVMDGLAQDGILDPLPEDVRRCRSPEWLAADGTWAAFGARLRVLVWRAGEDRPLPRSMESLPGALGPGERAALADPRFGTTRGHLEALAAALSEGAATATWSSWCSALAATDPLLLPGGNAAVVDAVASGDAAFGITDTDDVMAAIDAGRALAFRPIGLVDGTGACGEGSAFLIPNTVGIVKGGARPDAAASFARFLLSPEVEALLAASPSANIPLGGGVASGRIPMPGDGCHPSPRAIAGQLSAAGVDATATLLEACRGAALGTAQAP